jgi:hypothetical protein
MLQSRNLGWQDRLHESFEIPPLPAECSKMLWDLESKLQQKNQERRGEPERRKKNETRNEWGARTGRDCKEEEDYNFGK